MLSRRKEEKKRRREEANSSALELLERRRREYADSWKIVAGALERAGHYAWMADLLGGTAAPRGKRVLEVETGTGEGLRALLDRGWSVVSIDENVACLRAAHERVGGTVLFRGSPREAAEGGYEVAYRGTIPMGEARTVLVEGDVIGDDELADAVTARTDWTRLYRTG